MRTLAWIVAHLVALLLAALASTGVMAWRVEIPEQVTPPVRLGPAAESYLRTIQMSNAMAASTSTTVVRVTSAAAIIA